MTEGADKAGVSGEPIRSYQRIFTPDRRLYAIEGHPLPVPGGVPLRWVGHASGTLLAVLAVSAQSPAVLIAAALAGGVLGLGAGGRTGAVLAAVLTAGAVEVAGWVLLQLDWPMRLVVVPGAVATLGTQATPDGRRAHRFALSWLALRVAPRRLSLGRPLSHTAGEKERLGWMLWVAPDQHSARLIPGRVTGPAEISFRGPVEVRGRGSKLTVRQLGWRPRRGRIVHSLALTERDRMEVRP
jgi:hypothetical protein